MGSKAYDYKGINEFLAGVNVDILWDRIPWERRGDSPRFECWLARDHRPYTYGKGRGVRTYLSNAYQAGDIGRVWEFVEQILGQKFEGCFINGYQDGSDHLGWHSDDGPDIDPNRPIAVITFGAEREIWLRDIPVKFQTDKGLIDLPSTTFDKIRLQHGSIFLMNGGCQQTHQHRIPKADFTPCGRRISFTLRGLLPNGNHRTETLGTE